jgi:ribosomal protein S18 acetylase RimI-like enzyme
MNSSDTSQPAVVITRVAQEQWHALEDDRVVGRGHASRRPDGRMFLSVDAWHDAVFQRLAGALLAELPAPLYTVVDEGDLDLTANWQRAGFTIRRREWEYLVSTHPHVTRLGSVPAPPGVTVVGLGQAQEGPLRALDRVIRGEVEATVGWQEMPAEVLSVLDPSKYAVAVQTGEYVGFVRVTQVARQPRIGLIAVRADRRRQGIARALLAHVLGALHRVGIATASADVNESNTAATSLFEGIGGRRTSSNLELIRLKENPEYA